MQIARNLILQNIIKIIAADKFRRIKQDSAGDLNFTDWTRTIETGKYIFLL